MYVCMYVCMSRGRNSVHADVYAPIARLGNVSGRGRREGWDESKKEEFFRAIPRSLRRLSRPFPTNLRGEGKHDDDL